MSLLAGSAMDRTSRVWHVVLKSDSLATVSDLCWHSSEGGCSTPGTAALQSGPLQARAHEISRPSHTKHSGKTSRSHDSCTVAVSHALRYSAASSPRRYALEQRPSLTTHAGQHFRCGPFLCDRGCRSPLQSSSHLDRRSGALLDLCQHRSRRWEHAAAPQWMMERRSGPAWAWQRRQSSHCTLRRLACR